MRIKYNSNLRLNDLCKIHKQYISLFFFLKISKRDVPSAPPPIPNSSTSYYYYYVCRVILLS